MPTIQNQVAIAAASVNDNLLAGSQFEFLPFDASLEFAIVGDATASDLRVDVYSGQDVLLENAQPSAQNRIPVYPDDYNLTDVAGAGERLKIRVRNSGAATRQVFFALKITPI